MSELDIHVEITENMMQYLHFIHDNVYMNVLICIIAAVFSKFMYNYHVFVKMKYGDNIETSCENWSTNILS